MANPAAAYEALLAEARVLRIRLRRRAELISLPSREGFGRIRRDREAHVGVLLAAILRTLAAINPRPIRLEPCHVGLTGNELDLPAETRDPEGMNDVFAIEREAHWLSDWN